MRYLPLILGCLVLPSTGVAQVSTWLKVTTRNSPGPRWAHGNAHDFIRNRTIAFGGGDSNNKGNDTWEYDGSNWAKITPATMPPGRRLTAMAYHFINFSTVLFGLNTVTPSARLSTMPLLMNVRLSLCNVASSLAPIRTAVPPSPTEIDAPT